MIKSILMFCAEGVVRDAVTNNISVFNIVEELSSPSFPLFFGRLYVFNLSKRKSGDPEKLDLKLEILNNNTEIFKYQIKMDFEGKERNRVIFEIKGLAIPNPGKLRCILFHREKKLNSYEIKVNKIGKPIGKTN